MGKGEKLFVMGVSAIEKAFPKIRREGYKITSRETTDYNCFAWAVGETSQWWSPANSKGYYWPAGVPTTLVIGSFVKLYEAAGNFSPCFEHQFERGFEKIAIYADKEGIVTHVARQLSSGEWTSKLGDWEDIRHKNLAAIEGSFYGKVSQIMKRSV
jgi:hypothetical protein